MLAEVHERVKAEGNEIYVATCPTRKQKGCYGMCIDRTLHIGVHCTGCSRNRFSILGF